MFTNPVTQLPASGLTSGALTGTYTLTGTIRTAATGARVEVDSAGIRAYDATGANTVNVKSSDGSVAIVGQLSTASAGHRLELTSSPANQLLAYTGDAGELTPGLFEVSIHSGAVPSGDQGLITLQSPVLGTYSGIGGALEVWGASRDGTARGKVLITGDLQLNSGQISCLATGSVLYFPNGDANVKNITAQSLTLNGSAVAPLMAGRYSGAADSTGNLTVANVPTGWHLVSLIPNGPNAACYPNITSAKAATFYYDKGATYPWVGVPCASWSLDVYWIAAPG